MDLRASPLHVGLPVLVTIKSDSACCTGEQSDLPHRSRIDLHLESMYLAEPIGWLGRYPRVDRVVQVVKALQTMYCLDQFHTRFRDIIRRTYTSRPKNCINLSFVGEVLLLRKARTSCIP